MKTIADCISAAEEQLQATSPTPRLDAEILLCDCLNKPRSFLYAHSEDHLSAEVLDAFQALLTRRQQHEPVAYLTGHQEFWSMDLLVTHDTLIPRPETELMVELCLANVSSDKSHKIIDMGTGSGAIGLAIAKERPHWEVLATDHSAAAIDVAKQNATHHQITNITFAVSDWWQEVAAENKFNAILSNPPYVTEEERSYLSPETSFEPPNALFAPEQGLESIARIIQGAKAHLL